MIQVGENLLERVFPRIRRRPALAYPVAAVLFGLAVLLRAPLAAWLHLSFPFLTFFIAVVFTTLICGAGPGFAVVAAASGYSWYVLQDALTVGPKPTAAVIIAVFAVSASLLVLLLHFLNRLVEHVTAEQDRSEGFLQDSALSELQLEQLNVELRHRLKNTFAVINGLINQSARHSADIPSFASSLSGRLTAMGTAMDIVATLSFQGASLTELIARTLQPLVPPGGSRLITRGPETVVSGDVASALGLVLHELGTNAIKYGAWSNTSGAVSVSWDVQTLDEDEIKLDLLWAESGGPKVGTPERKGLGSALIDGGFPSARVERSFRPEGVRCRIISEMRLATTRRTRRHRR